MRASSKDSRTAEKPRREENGEGGLSLIELIVVVVILGIVVAIAIPVFLGLQTTAQRNALEAAAANMAVQVVTQIASGGTVTSFPVTEDGIEYTSRGTIGTLDAICISAAAGGQTGTAGPGCQ